MTNFYAALPEQNALRLSCIWEQIFFDTKQAMKEHFLSPDERDAILDYFGALIPED